MGKRQNCAIVAWEVWVNEGIELVSDNLFG